MVGVSTPDVHFGLGRGQLCSPFLFRQQSPDPAGDPRITQTHAEHWSFCRHISSHTYTGAVLGTRNTLHRQRERANEYSNSSRSTITGRSRKQVDCQYSPSLEFPAASASTRPVSCCRPPYRSLQDQRRPSLWSSCALGQLQCPGWWKERLDRDGWRGALPQGWPLLLRFLPA